MTKSNWKLVITFIILFSLLAWAMLSCKLIKDVQRSSVDTTSVKKINTAAVDTGTGGATKRSMTKEEFDWWKKTETYQPAAPGVTNVYPSTVVYEGGKGTKETNTFDSAWFKNALSLMQSQYDSLNTKTEEYRKQSETKTKGLGTFFIVLICIGCFILYLILSKYLKRFKIVKS